MSGQDRRPRWRPRPDRCSNGFCGNRTSSYNYVTNPGLLSKITGHNNKFSSINYHQPRAESYTPSSITSRANRTVDMVANAYGEITRHEDPANNATTTIYNTQGLPATSARLNRTTITYNTNGYPTQITDALNQSIVITPVGRPTRIVDRRGFRTDYTYDDAG